VVGLAGAAPGPGWAQTLVRVEAPRVLLGAGSLGLRFFPDSSLFCETVRGQPVCAAADGGRAGAPEQGSILLTGALDHLVPLQGGEAEASLHGPADPGGAFTEAFERDYVGGGPLLWDAHSDTLLHAYHAEYHFDRGRGADFYSSIGLAVSRDGGRSFSRLGLIVRPAIPPEQHVRTPTSAGTLVPVGDQLYLYYGDLSADRTCDGSPQGGLPCLALASAPRAAVLQAAASGQAVPWHKYYHGAFGEPGIGGNFSPLVVADAGHWLRWPDVKRDAASGWFFMVYAAGNNGLELRTSRDGLVWGAALPILAAPPDTAINYPSIVELAHASPGPGGKARFALTIAYAGIAREGGRINFADRRLMAIGVLVER
jgi:hypothetical protein